ncbi:PREDICTED: wall-associated receptor kinase-like 8 isoform X1 [Prunus mume]|uniref:Wall-associated receptor kinase-like 8 isoform X1 n=1 Tax=Prunus mume TaxID=102107 RepID=A0ABM1LKV0_PRUMU|nr:PREDICTED: wall-associated receptor kinase-like 8 isoform X1 [Prunus mume]
MFIVKKLMRGRRSSRRMNIVQITLFLWYMSAVASEETSLAKPDCSSQCGLVTQIPYPFGIEDGCYLGDWFQIMCDNSTNPSRAFMNVTGLEVLEISVEGTLKVKSPITFSNCSNKPVGRQTPNLEGSPFVFSQKNRFTSLSCGGVALMTSLDGSTIAGCLSICDYTSTSYLRTKSCIGMNCCQTTITPYLRSFSTSFGALLLNADRQTCKYAFLVEHDWFTSNSTNVSAIGEMDYVPMVLEWHVFDLNYTKSDIYGTNNWRDDKSTECSSSQCFCSKGHHGNPYLLHGCQDINECDDPGRCGSGICFNYPGGFKCQLPDQRSSRVTLAIIVPSSVLGLLFLLTGIWWAHKVIKKRKDMKRKEKFFRQNGGLVLEQQLSSGELNVEKVKLFNCKELEKATDHFNADRVIGQGGQGTVYKGMLADGRIVAVKKSKIVEGGEVRQFINEIVILSQISHRNVVKLLGCCLETEVPLLVYEFIPNGTLFQYIHHQNEEFPLTWETRLRVSIEVAGALSYLHSAASFPIYHRDVKSSNILLDEKYRAKVADFGTSRSISIDQTHLTTLVRGTFGYLDPEYFQSSQFTEKSDVYSFGVVLAELLTGQKPVSFMRSPESRSLATYFLLSMEDNNLFAILDAQVMKDGGKDQIVAVANLTKACLNLNGRKRPTMKEVAVELEGIQLSVKASGVQQNFAEVEYDQSQITEPWYVSSLSTGSCMDSGTSSSFFESKRDSIYNPIIHTKRQA